MIETRETWEEFLQDWRVYSLLQPAETPSPRAGGTLVIGGTRLPVDQVKRHLGRELLDAARVQAYALGITLVSVAVEVSVMPLVQASAEVPGNQPWIRYKLTVETQATQQQLAQLHRRVQTCCVQRLERDYHAPIAGSLLPLIRS